MSLTKNSQRSVRLSPAEDKVFTDACEKAGLSPADAMRAAMMEWARSCGENAQLKALAREQKLLVDAIVGLTERFDSCVQLNVEEGSPTAKILTQAAAAKFEEAALVGAEN